MKQFLLLPLLSALACSNLARVKVDYLHPIKPEIAALVVRSVKNTPTFITLNELAKRPLVTVEEEVEGGIWVNLWSIGKDFIHRWATLRVDPITGRVLKLGTDADLEDTWTVEYDPPGWK